MRHLSIVLLFYVVTGPLVRSDMPGAAKCIFAAWAFWLTVKMLHPHKPLFSKRQP